MEMSLSMRAVPVCDTAIAWWSPGHQGENIKYLSSVQSNYYRIVAIELMNSESREDPAVMLMIRSMRDHAAELLFATLLSLLQDPIATCIWMTKYSNERLRSSVGDLLSEKPILTWKGEVVYSIDSVVNDIFSGKSSLGTQYDEELNQKTTSFLRSLANQFVDPLYYLEYNSIKHGLRAKVTGSKTASIRHRKSPGADNQAELQSGDASIDSFHSNKAWGQSHHVTLSGQSLSWDSEQTCVQLCIINDIIEGIVTRLKMLNGFSGPFRWKMLDNLEAFEDCWKRKDREFIAFVPEIVMNSETPSPITVADLKRDLKSRTQ